MQHRFFTFLLLFFAVIICTTFFLQYTEIITYKSKVLSLATQQNNLQQELDTYKKREENLKKVVVNTKEKNSSHTLVGDIIASYVNNTPGNVSVYFKNLTTEETVLVDPERPYYMASLYKVFITLYVLDEIKKGNLSLTQTVGSPAISIEKALEKIITESNNEYAVSLAEKFGWETIEKAMKAKMSVNFTFTKSLEANVTNIGLLFERIAESLRLTDDQSTYVLELLNQQTKTSKLPKYLPQHIYSHNKTGELDDFSHDAGIFYTPKANYILIFMSKTPNPGNTNEQMAKMSRDIYSALNEL